MQAICSKCDRRLAVILFVCGRLLETSQLNAYWLHKLPYWWLVMPDKMDPSTKHIRHYLDTSTALISSPLQDILSSDVLQMDIITYMRTCINSNGYSFAQHRTVESTSSWSTFGVNLNVSCITEWFTAFCTAIQSDTTNIACHVSKPVHRQQFSNAVGEVDVTQISRQQHMTVLRLNVCWT